MGCRCDITEIVLGAVILLFMFWQVSYSRTIIIIAAVLLIIHALKCKNCKMQAPGGKKK